MAKFGIPYMGSKGKIAESISMLFPKADNFYDLFGGGFSISHCMLMTKSHRFKNFHYNEIKADVVELVKKAIAGEYSDERFKPAWISREDFFASKDSDAYIRCCWSFGNNQKGYLFGTEIELYKKSMHLAVISDEFDETARRVFGFSEWPSNVKTIKQRRYFLRQKVQFDSKGMRRGALQQLERVQQLQQLERLQQLEQLEQLACYSMDYRDVPILSNAVVYCDIPYFGTADYGEFNHAEFFDWASSRDFPVYISEYEIKDSRFKLIYEVDKRSLLSSKKANVVKSERVYWNGI